MHLPHREPKDRDHVDLSAPAEVLRWWCRWFGCSEAELRDAVQTVGVSARSVRNYLRTTPRRK